MIPNPIAIQMGKEPQAASIDFFPEGGSAPFLKPEESLGWFWPYHALRAPEGLYLFLLQLERADLPPPFGFKLVSNWLGHVRNPEDLPQRWIISQRKIPWGNAQRQFGSFVLVKESYCYIFGTVAEWVNGRISWHMILARAPIDRLSDFNSWLFFREGEWGSNVDGAIPSRFTDVRKPSGTLEYAAMQARASRKSPRRPKTSSSLMLPTPAMAILGF